MAFILKEVDGAWWWLGTPTNNALDRDREIISAEAIQTDVAKNTAPGELWYSHLPSGEYFRLGGAPSHRWVVKGVLCEVGVFDDTPLAKAVARYIADHPKGVDGSGWGMSHGFHGVADGDGVYHLITMRERSVLPLSRAANPYTKFGVTGEVDMDAQAKKALDELAQILSASTDPAVTEAAKGILAAAETAQELDAQGVQRKATQDTDEPDADEEDTLETDTGAISEEVLGGIKAYVLEVVGNALSDVTDTFDALAKSVAGLMDRLDRVDAGQVAAKAHNEMPRSTYERMRMLPASQSPETVINGDDPLTKGVRAAPSNPFEALMRKGK